MLLPILSFPDPRLRTKADEVKTVDKSVKTLIKDMFETMYARDGIGLAATQTNNHLRIIVMDVPENDAEYQELLDNRDSQNNDNHRKKYTKLCFINPVIKKLSADKTHISEGCLSVPDYKNKVERSKSISVTALDAEGEAFELEASGLLSICIQHEIDHLNGILFIDYMSKLKQQRLLEKVKKADLKL